MICLNIFVSCIMLSGIWSPGSQILVLHYALPCTVMSFGSLEDPYDEPWNEPSITEGIIMVCEDCHRPGMAGNFLCTPSTVTNTKLANIQEGNIHSLLFTVFLSPVSAFKQVVNQLGPV